MCFSYSWTLFMDSGTLAAHPELLKGAEVLRQKRRFRDWTDDRAKLGLWLLGLRRREVERHGAVDVDARHPHRPAFIFADGPHQAIDVHRIAGA
jgi:hypothetical protein